MKKLSLILTIVILSNQFIYSQYGWHQQPSGTSNRLNKICNDRLYSQSNFWIAGNNGTILRSTNYGVNWTSCNSGTNRNLNSIFFFNDYIGFCVGDSGTILKTNSGGQIWSQQSSGTTLNLNDITGISWDYPEYYSELWVVGNGGKILTSTDDGASWQARTSGINPNLHAVLRLDSLNKIAAGDNGIILKSSDAGYFWDIENTGTNANLNNIYFDNSGFYLYSCGNNGTLLRSFYYGYQWQIINSGVNVNLNSIATGLFSYIAGDGGLILKSTNSGNNWIAQSSATNANLHSILFTSSNAGWAVGDNGTIINTMTDNYAITFARLNANTINSGYTNRGYFNCDSSLNNSPGFEWPKGQGTYARFSSGLWIGAEIGSDTVVSSTLGGSPFLPGYTDNSGNPHGSNDPVYRVYKLKYGVNDSDRAKWPNALLGNSDQGAPVYFDVTSNSWKALDCGEQTTFYAYTDSYLYMHSFTNDTIILKADIKQLNYSMYYPAAGGDIIINQFTIINRNNVPWNNAYITVWSDDDLGESTDDVTGCDSTLQIGFTYNGTNIDAVYGIAPPAVSFNLLKGPSVHTGNINDTDFICNGRTKILRTGYKQIGLKVFNNYNIQEEPNYYYQQYRNMAGFDNYGNPRINPFTGQQTKFIFSGDPESGQGWNQPNFDDQRIMLSMGPLNMNSGDTQVVVVAQTVARGTSNKNSVTKLKQLAPLLRSSYNNCFSDVPISVINNSEVPYKFWLSQNYPNPFNPKTTINYQIAKTGNVNIIIYDILGKEAASLVNTVQNPGVYKTEWDGSNFASGVYFYRIISGNFTDVKKMVLIK